MKPKALVVDDVEVVVKLDVDALAKPSAEEDAYSPGGR
jgi:hypothetical protein